MWVGGWGGGGGGGGSMYKHYCRDYVLSCGHRGCRDVCCVMCAAWCLSLHYGKYIVRAVLPDITHLAPPCSVTACSRLAATPSSSECAMFNCLIDTWCGPCWWWFSSCVLSLSSFSVIQIYTCVCVCVRVLRVCILLLLMMMLLLTILSLTPAPCYHYKSLLLSKTMCVCSLRVVLTMILTVAQTCGVVGLGMCGVVWQVACIPAG